MIGRIIICCLLFSLNVAVQGQETTDSVTTQENKSGLMARLHQIQQYLDNKAKKKVDSNYIEVPKKPWRVILRYKENVVDVDYSQSLDFPATNEQADWNLCFEPPVASSVGFWVGYHGAGFSYSKSLTKNAGRYYSFSSTGAKYGINFRLRRFNTEDAKFSSTAYENGQVTGKYDTDVNMASPVWIRSVYINGYYVFNGRRYSQAAAYNQSVIQRRSAGSLLVGATWYQSSFDYADISNAFFMIIGHGISRIKVHQASLGIGYGYNWVPFRGLVVNVMAMPTVSVYNRVKAYKYETNYDTSDIQPVDDFGDWNPETRRWANGKTHKPLLMLNREGGNQFDYWDAEPEVHHSMLRLNLDLRLGIAYNFSNYFIGAQAQYNNFHYKTDNCKVNIFDAYARLAFGVRL
jgi:hypothetical protein